jgi:hypothetical protein
MSHPPNDPAALAEAQAAAEGDTVMPITPAEVKPGMVIRHAGAWLTVRFKSMAGDAFHVDFVTDEQGATAFKFFQHGTALYRRVANDSRPDAIDAPEQQLMIATPVQPVLLASCPCDGSGTYTVSIPVADAVVSATRQCSIHGQPPPRNRLLAFDTASNCIGEVMDTADAQGSQNLYWLRPIGGGREWTVQPQDLQLFEDDALRES